VTASPLVNSIQIVLEPSRPSKRSPKHLLELPAILMIPTLIPMTHITLMMMMMIPTPSPTPTALLTQGVTSVFPSLTSNSSRVLLSYVATPSNPSNGSASSLTLSPKSNSTHPPSQTWFSQLTRRSLSSLSLNLK
jgi:hypothetical protein